MSRRNICFYVSDYGNGHAARSIAIIRRILQEWDDARVYVKTAGPAAFMQQSLPSCIHIPTQNDIGVVLQPDRPVVDHDQTEQIFRIWIQSWDDYILHELKFCKEMDIDCIISDIAPQPFRIADALSIPGIAISNFTWHLVFSHLFGRTTETEQLREAYGLADLAFMLPLHEPMDVFPVKQEIGLVSRAVTADRDHLRRRLGIGPDDRLIYVSTGPSLHPALQETLKRVIDPRIKILVSSNFSVRQENVIAIPEGEMETQNYLAACDLIVAKCGYSTISEAVQARVPILLYRREGFAEDSYLIRGVESRNLGKEIAWPAFLQGEWLDSLPELDNYKRTHMSESSIFSNGADDVVSILHEVLL